jgi:hypothetical protein
MHAIEINKRTSYKAINKISIEVYIIIIKFKKLILYKLKSNNNKVELLDDLLVSVKYIVFCNE